MHLYLHSYLVKLVEMSHQDYYDDDDDGDHDENNNNLGFLLSSLDLQSVAKNGTLAGFIFAITLVNMHQI